MKDHGVDVRRIKQNLCSYDKRSPYYDEENGEKGKQCFCDNCFYGNTEMAEIILKLIGEE